MKRIICAILACAVCSCTAAAMSGCGCNNHKPTPGYTVETTAPDIEDADFGFYIIDKDKLMVTKYSGTDKDIVIPGSYKNYTVTTIGDFLFTSSDITSVKFPDSITDIQSNAFASCSNLTSVQLPKNLKKLGSNAFFNCRNLETIEIPASVEDLGIYTFCGSGMKSVTIPESETLTKIDNYVFYQCPYLEEVNLPATVTEINENAFADCKKPITIKAPSGSYAEEYAKKLNFKFVATD